MKTFITNDQKQICQTIASEIARDIQRKVYNERFDLDSGEYVDTIHTMQIHIKIMACQEILKNILP